MRFNIFSWVSFQPWLPQVWVWVCYVACPHTAECVARRLTRWTGGCSADTGRNPDSRWGAAGEDQTVCRQRLSELSPPWRLGWRWWIPRVFSSSRTSSVPAPKTSASRMSLSPSPSITITLTDLYNNFLRNKFTVLY